MSLIGGIPSYVNLGDKRQGRADKNEQKTDPDQDGIALSL